MFEGKIAALLSKQCAPKEKHGSGYFDPLVFVVVAALMMTKKIPTLLAPPLMAILICVIVQVFQCLEKTATEKKLAGWTSVFEVGTARMGAAIMAVIFGAWLGQLMNKTGVTETIITVQSLVAISLVITLIMSIAVAVLFTTLSGLGSIIMVIQSSCQF